jgi:hypothetical protein
VQHDYGTEVNHLCCDESMDQGRRLRKPWQPFADSRSGEACQKETDCEPCSVAGGSAGTLDVHTINGEAEHNDDEIAERSRQKQLSIGQERTSSSVAEA